MRLIKRALISVSDKTGIVDFARELSGFGVEIISTGGTAKTLREAGLPVRDISEITGFPEMMDGRVKTLHPRVHGGLLAIRDNPDHLAAMQQNGIEAIDLVVVNLYPFAETIQREGVSREEAIEQIDIGGPAMIRSAAKNSRDVAVVVSPDQYRAILDELKEHKGALSLKTRNTLAQRAFEQTAQYDLTVSSYLAGSGGPRRHRRRGVVRRGSLSATSNRRLARSSNTQNLPVLALATPRPRHIKRPWLPILFPRLAASWLLTVLWIAMRPGR